jgi:hypothetical protein
LRRNRSRFESKHRINFRGEIAEGRAKTLHVIVMRDSEATIRSRDGMEIVWPVGLHSRRHPHIPAFINRTAWLGNTAELFEGQRSGGMDQTQPLVDLPFPFEPLSAVSISFHAAGEGQP